MGVESSAVLPPPLALPPWGCSPPRADCPQRLCSGNKMPVQGPESKVAQSPPVALGMLPL